MEEFNKLIEKLQKEENRTGIDILLSLWMEDLKKYHDTLEYGKLNGAIYGMYGTGYITKKETDIIQDYLTTIFLHKE